MANQVGGVWPEERPWRKARLVYLVALAILTVLDVVLEEFEADTSDWVTSTVAVIGSVTFAVGLAVHRPRPRPAWTLTSLGFLFLAASGVVANSTNAARSAESPAVIVPAGLGLLFLAAGLAEFSRHIARRGPTDSIDATIAALAAYLLLWTVLIAPALESNPEAAAAAILLPIGSLLVLAAGTRLALAGGWRLPPVAVLLGASFGAVIAFALMLANGSLNQLWTNEALFVFEDLYFIAVGFLGLSPSLLRQVARLPEGEQTPSRQRVVLFALLAMVPPAIWLARALGAAPAQGHGRLVFVPPLVSALLLLLLVLRLGLISRLAHNRADALAASNRQQAELQRELEYQARHDPLTGLFNRTVLGETVEAALRAQPAVPVALLLIDLDRFKDVNDWLGHSVGDDLLVAVAQRLRRIAPTQCTLVRLGGDEFAILVDGNDADRAAEIGQDLVSQLRQPYQLGGHELSITSSVGIQLTNAATPRPSPADLLREADQALYAAKAAGKDQVRVFSAPGNAIRAV